MSLRRPAVTGRGVGLPVPSYGATVAAVLVCVAMVGLWYYTAPEAGGQTAFTVVMALSAVVTGAAPLVRRTRPPQVWAVLPWIGLLLLAAAFDDYVDWMAGPFEYSDVVFLSAYGAIIIWLVLLARVDGGPWNHYVLLDTSAACVGALLAVWTGVVAPVSVGVGLGTGIVWAAYPPLDVIMLALGAHLALRLRRVPAPLKWFLAAVSLWLFTDTAYASIEVHSPVAWDIPVLEVGFLFAHVFLAVALAHPDLEQLSPQSQHVPDDPTPARHAALVVFAAVPAVFSAAIPEVSLGDIIVRTLLLAVLLVLLFARLSRTMSALTTAETDSRYRAHHDPLTGLKNRSALHDAIGRRLEEAAAGETAAALVFIDCDDFKRINDTWGHAAGDSLLKDLATQLTAAAGPTAVVARQGGDEFVVVDAVADEAAAQNLAERLREVFDQPLRILPDRTHHATGSIGAAMARAGESCSIDALLTRADTAMYAAKRQGKGGSVFFDQELAEEMQVRSVVGDRLGALIADDGFSVVYQPIMGGPGYRTLLGWEALARWTDPDLGEVSPEVFVAVAEDLGLVGRLGEWVLRRACDHLASLRKTCPDQSLSIAVNVSPSQLKIPGFAELVKDVLDETGLPGSALHLEVTETVFLDPESPAVDVLRQVRESGVWVCVDDFGTGYASLATLLQLPADCVKLDRTLVARLGDGPAARHQLAAVLALVRSLGIEALVAEGVETPEQARILAELGCPAVQGWLYGRPACVDTTADAAGATDRAVGA